MGARVWQVPEQGDSVNLARYSRVEEMWQMGEIWRWNQQAWCLIGWSGCRVSGSPQLCRGTVHRDGERGGRSSVICCVLAFPTTCPGVTVYPPVGNTLLCICRNIKQKNSIKRGSCQLFKALSKGCQGVWELWKVKVLVARWCLTLCDPMAYISPGSSVHGNLQARLWELWQRRNHFILINCTSKLDQVSTLTVLLGR